MLSIENDFFIHLIEMELNSYDNPTLTIEIDQQQQQNKENEENRNETTKSESRWMTLSLTFHSLGIIFGDM